MREDITDFDKYISDNLWLILKQQIVKFYYCKIKTTLKLKLKFKVKLKPSAHVFIFPGL